MTDELTWLNRYMDLARLVASWSKDPSTRVGAVLGSCAARRGENAVWSVGYNGFPRGFDDDPGRLSDRAAKYPRTVHAEVNAVLNLRGMGVDMGDSLLVVTTHPCSACALFLVQARVRRVVWAARDGDPRMEREPWKSDALVARDILSEGLVETRVLWE